jgi:hypothetical protein
MAFGYVTTIFFSKLEELGNISAELEVQQEGEERRRRLEGRKQHLEKVLQSEWHKRANHAFLVFIPVNLGENHWVLCAINFLKIPFEFILYDSLVVDDSRNRARLFDQLKPLVGWLLHNALLISNPPNTKLKSNSVSIMIGGCPRQTDMESCGLCLLKNVMALMSQWEHQINILGLGSGTNVQLRKLESFYDIDDPIMIQTYRRDILKLVKTFAPHLSDDSNA